METSPLNEKCCRHEADCSVSFLAVGSESPAVPEQRGMGQERTVAQTSLAACGAQRYQDCPSHQEGLQSHCDKKQKQNNTAPNKVIRLPSTPKLLACTGPHCDDQGCSLTQDSESAFNLKMENLSIH